MDHLVLVDKLHALYQLLYVVASFQLVQALPSAHEVAQRLIVANIKHYVNVVLVLEVAVKAHDVFVMKGPVDLDFRSQLLTGLAPGQVLL